MLRGPFTGCSYIRNACVKVFGNQTGDAPAFYYADEEYFAASSDFNMLVELLRKEHKMLEFDEVYANHIFSLSYAAEGHTVIKQVKKVQPGHEVILDLSGVSEQWYFKFDDQPKTNMTMEEAVEELDIRFKNAVKRCFDKDLEYGFTHHLVDMSGGFDSRMTNWAAKALGYENITNVTYAKSGSYDGECGRKAAEALGNEHLFYGLDGLEFIYDLESLVTKNYGLAVYAGSTGADRMLAQMDFTKFGLEHTGLIGDSIVGSCCKDTKDVKVNADKLRSTEYSGIEPILTNQDEYGSMDIFAVYYPNFQGNITSSAIRQNYTTAVSPFIDVDFCQFCLKLPLQYRCDHNIYYKWFETKYPGALAIPSTRKPPKKKALFLKMYYSLPSDLKFVIRRFIKKVSLLAGNKKESDETSLSPVDYLNYWYLNNEKMRSFINGYFDENIALLNNFPKTKRDAQKMFAQDVTMPKLLVLTVLAAKKIYLQSI